jgi:hypothetical protein
MLARRDCRDDIRVIEARGNSRFAYEALAKAVIPSKLRRKQL